jgi:hypothetical protein
MVEKGRPETYNRNGVERFLAGGAVHNGDVAESIQTKPCRRMFGESLSGGDDKAGAVRGERQKTPS